MLGTFLPSCYCDGVRFRTLSRSRLQSETAMIATDHGSQALQLNPRLLLHRHSSLASLRSGHWAQSADQGLPNSPPPQ